MKGICAFLLILVFVGFSLSGCATTTINQAERLLSDLKAQGGEKLVPYEYGSAETFLEVARREYDQSDYNSAKEFADRSTAASQQGLAEIKKKK